MLTMDIATQIFKILKQPDLKYLTQVLFFLYIYIMFCPFHFSFIATKKNKEKNKYIDDAITV